MNAITTAPGKIETGIIVDLSLMASRDDTRRFGLDPEDFALATGVRRSLWTVVMGWLGTAFAAVRAEIRIRDELRHLNRLSDHALRDMGLSRGELEFELRNGRSGSMPD